MIISATSTSIDARLRLVNELRRTLGSEIRIVHAAVDAHCGSLGSEPRYSYTFTFPRFHEALTALTQLHHGDMVEFI